MTLSLLNCKKFSTLFYPEQSAINTKMGSRYIQNKHLSSLATVFISRLVYIYIYTNSCTNCAMTIFLLTYKNICNNFFLKNCKLKNHNFLFFRIMALPFKLIFLNIRDLEIADIVEFEE